VSSITRVRAWLAALERDGYSPKTRREAIEIGARLRHRDLQTSEGYVHQRRGAVSHIEPLPLEIPADRPRGEKVDRSALQRAPV
jgi:hypothetical protein